MSPRLCRAAPASPTCWLQSCKRKSATAHDSARARRSTESSQVAKMFLWLPDCTLPASVLAKKSVSRPCTSSTVVIYTRVLARSSYVEDTVTIVCCTAVQTFSASMQQQWQCKHRGGRERGTGMHLASCFKRGSPEGALPSPVCCADIQESCGKTQQAEDCASWNIDRLIDR